MWNILYSQTGHIALICGIYCRARQATVRWHVDYIVETGHSALICGIYFKARQATVLWYVEYIVEPNRPQCVGMWNILYSLTGHSALICGIYCTARQATVRWYVEYIVEPNRPHFADMWYIFLIQTGHSVLICDIYCKARQATVCWYVDYIVEPDWPQFADTHCCEYESFAVTTVQFHIRYLFSTPARVLSVCHMHHQVPHTRARENIFLGNIILYFSKISVKYLS